MTLRFYGLFLMVFYICSTLLFRCSGEQYSQGKVLYGNFCSACHMDDGSGLKGAIPSLVNNATLRDDIDAAVCYIRHGKKTGNYAQDMDAIPALNETEIANILNYVNHAWGHDFGFVKITDVKAALDKCND